LSRAEAPGSFTNAISGECWIINDEKVEMMRQEKITPDIPSFRDNRTAILNPGTEVFVLWGSKGSDCKYCLVMTTRQKVQGWILATSIISAQKSKK
jgi:GH43 family beta-xylosidase